MMYATARFNVYVMWIAFDKAEDMQAERDEAVRYYTDK